jgi:uncharacterized protein
MGRLRTTTREDELLALLRAAGGNAERTAVLLRDLLADYPERAELAEAIRDLEHEGDRLTHDAIHRLTERGDADARTALSVGDGHALATAIDDIVDYAEEAADRIGLYGIEAPMEQASALSEVLVAAAAEVVRALDGLRAGSSMADAILEIHRLEDAGDRIEREALGSLFAGGIDPMMVIRWKDVFEALECAVDACEQVAHVLEGVALKRR